MIAQNVGIRTLKPKSKVFSKQSFWFQKIENLKSITLYSNNRVPFNMWCINAYHSLIFGYKVLNTITKFQQKKIRQKNCINKKACTYKIKSNCTNIENYSSCIKLFFDAKISIILLESFCSDFFVLNFFWKISIKSNQFSGFA